jgi:hypothetical protein
MFLVSFFLFLRELCSRDLLLTLNRSLYLVLAHDEPEAQGYAQPQDPKPEGPINRSCRWNRKKVEEMYE